VQRDPAQVAVEETPERESPGPAASLRSLAFEPINAQTLALARHRVEQALVLWEPRIDSIGVSASADPARGLIQLELRYRVRSTNTFYNLVYPFYLLEGGER